MARSYKMTKRAQSAAGTSDNILTATERLLTVCAPGSITLQTIADQAGVTVQTILRHMESRQGCLNAVAQRVKDRVDKQRGRIVDFDGQTSIEQLVTHYESEGKLVLNLLKHEEDSDAFFKSTTELGRQYHRDWVERCFADSLREGNDCTIDALIAITDIYTWKLLRLDMGRSIEDTKNTILYSVKALLEAQK